MSENVGKMEKADNPATVPYVAYESAQARMERVNKRLFWALIAAIVVILATNGGWIWYESQFETISYSQDGAGLNNINTGEHGDVYGAEAKNQEEAQR